MAVGSTSSDTEVQAQIDDNVGYRRNRSVPMAYLYQEAIEIMVARLSRRAEMSDAGSSLKVQLQGLMSSRDQVLDFLKLYDTSGDNIVASRTIYALNSGFQR